MFFFFRTSEQSFKKIAGTDSWKSFGRRDAPIFNVVRLSVALCHIQHLRGNIEGPRSIARFRHLIRQHQLLGRLDLQDLREPVSGRFQVLQPDAGQRGFLGPVWLADRDPRSPACASGRSGCRSRMHTASPPRPYSRAHPELTRTCGRRTGVRIRRFLIADAGTYSYGFFTSLVSARGSQWTKVAGPKEPRAENVRRTSM
jgi:hypothetical protein